MSSETTIYNEGRVVGYSAYELYVRQFLNDNPDGTPATEKEWLASSLAYGSSLILNIPEDSQSYGANDLHVIELSLPTNSRLRASNIIYANLTDIDVEDYGNVGYPTAVGSYSDNLIPNTEDLSPLDAIQYDTVNLVENAKDTHIIHGFVGGQEINIEVTDINFVNDDPNADENTPGYILTSDMIYIYLYDENHELITRRNIGQDIMVQNKSALIDAINGCAEFSLVNGGIRYGNKFSEYPANAIEFITTTTPFYNNALSGNYTDIPININQPIVSISNSELAYPNTVSIFGINAGSDPVSICNLPNASSYLNTFMEYESIRIFNRVGNIGTVTLGIRRDATNPPYRNPLIHRNDKDVIENYLKIQDGVVIQGGSWYDNDPDNLGTLPKALLSPNLSTTPIIRLLIKGKITSTFNVLFTGFSDSSILNGVYSDLSNGVNHPENGDFLGPGKFPWAGKILFGINSTILDTMLTPNIEDKTVLLYQAPIKFTPAQLGEYLDNNSVRYPSIKFGINSYFTKIGEEYIPLVSQPANWVTAYYNYYTVSYVSMSDVAEKPAFEINKYFKLGDIYDSANTILIKNCKVPYTENEWNQIENWETDRDDIYILKYSAIEPVEFETDTFYLADKTLISEEPIDWNTSLQNYYHYTQVSYQIFVPEFREGYYYDKSGNDYIELISQPDDWVYNYMNFYVFTNAIPIFANESQYDYYGDAYILLDEGAERNMVLSDTQPGDWNTNYWMYYTHHSAPDYYVPVAYGSTPTWEANKYYSSRRGSSIRYADYDSIQSNLFEQEQPPINIPLLNSNISIFNYDKFIVSYKSIQTYYNMSFTIESVECKLSQNQLSNISLRSWESIPPTTSNILYGISGVSNYTRYPISHTTNLVSIILFYDAVNHAIVWNNSSSIGLQIKSSPYQYIQGHVGIVKIEGILK